MTEPENQLQEASSLTADFMALLDIMKELDNATQKEVLRLRAENQQLKAEVDGLRSAMQAGEITIEKCNDCGCDVATWNSGSAVLCWNCDMNEEDE